jgi:anti-anti-sigma factor
MDYVTVVRRDQSFVIRLGTSFDFESRHDFRQALERAPDETRTYFVDLSDTLQIDSSGLGLLLLLREVVGEERDRVHLANARPAVKNAILAINFDSLFTLDEGVVLLP